MAATIVTSLKTAPAEVNAFQQSLRNFTQRPTGLCGFDGFIDTFIRLENPATMAEFGPKVTAAAGIAASYPVQHLGDKFGGNGPLLASGLHGLCSGQIDLTYIGALGDPEILPIFAEALEDKLTKIYSIANPAHSDCLEFRDGKIMLGDLRTCAEVSWERVTERVGLDNLDQLLQSVDFLGAVNWGKLVNVGSVWTGLADRLDQLGRTDERIPFFMDLAEFEQRSMEDRAELLQRVARITKTCHTLLSMNLKEAWQMAESFDRDYHGKKDPADVVELAEFLQDNIAVDRLIVHPNKGAAIASADGAHWVSGPYCADPLVSTGAGDHFGAGCLLGAAMGLDDFSLILLGVATSGYYVRSGRSPALDDLADFVDQWTEGTIPDRL